MSEIPTEEQWGSWKSDVDLASAHNIFFGKSNAEVQDDFYRCVIERADELRYMPNEVFQYYILGFKDFIMAGKFQLFDSADAADSFLKLIEHKLKNSYESLKPVFSDIYPAIEYVCQNQVEFDADINIYGDFSERLEGIKKAIGK